MAENVRLVHEPWGTELRAWLGSVSANASSYDRFIISSDPESTGSPQIRTHGTEAQTNDLGVIAGVLHKADATQLPSVSL